MEVPFFRHNIGPEEIEELLDTLNDLFITTGPKTKLFEERFSEYLNVQYCIGCTSWTMAAFLVLKAWGIGPGDEVIVPSMSFIATSNVILHCGATPIFVDVEPKTGNIDPHKVEAVISPKTKAIIPVHLYGLMSDMKTLRSLANNYNLKILEDAAQCVEAQREGVKPGHLGDAACFSFQAIKNISCGEGGAIVTNDESLFKALRLLYFHGINKTIAERYTSKYRHWDMEILGYKANMPDIQASLLLNQLKTIHEKWQRREKISQYYESTFSAIGIAFPRVVNDAKSARNLFTLWVNEAENRDYVLAKLQSQGIGVGIHYRAIHLMSYYAKQFGFSRGCFPVAEKIGDTTITIPLYPKMMDEEVEYVAQNVVSIINKL